VTLVYNIFVFQRTIAESDAMTQTVEAVYKNGQLQLSKPIALAEGTAVRVTITPLVEQDPFGDLIGICHSGRTDGAANHDQYLQRKRGR
jgi:predicted DNA-binding antitoxin AbrB/MazE fold protein